MPKCAIILVWTTMTNRGGNEMNKTYKIEIETEGGKIVWTNGGMGYTESELDKAVKRIENHKSAIGYTIKLMKKGAWR